MPKNKSVKNAGRVPIFLRISESIDQTVKKRQKREEKTLPVVCLKRVSLIVDLLDRWGKGEIR
jgi:hypothetical protein